MKIHLVRAEFFHADGRTDTTKLTVVFRSFANSPKTSIKDKGSYCELIADSRNGVISGVGPAASPSPACTAQWACLLSVS
jgi:hypothetical protein